MSNCARKQSTGSDISVADTAEGKYHEREGTPAAAIAVETVTRNDFRQNGPNQIERCIRRGIERNMQLAVLHPPCRQTPGRDTCVHFNLADIATHSLKRETGIDAVAPTTQEPATRLLEVYACRSGKSSRQTRLRKESYLTPYDNATGVRQRAWSSLTNEELISARQ